MAGESEDVGVSGGNASGAPGPGRGALRCSAPCPRAGCLSSPPSAREALLPTHCEPRENLSAKSFGFFLIENKNEKNKQKRWKTKTKL